MTDEATSTASEVAGLIERKNVATHIVSTQSLPLGSLVTLRLGRGQLRVPGDTKAIDLEECAGVWVWHCERPAAKHSDAFVAAYVTQEWRLAVDGLSAVIPPSRWINDPAKLRWLEGNKLVQLDLAKRSGLAIPRTVVTNDVRSLREAFRPNERLAVKTLGGVQRQRPNREYETVYTQVSTVAELEARSEAVRQAPIVVQAYAEKLYELRVTIVDDAVFACRIESQASDSTRVDYRRYASPHVPHHAVDLPSKIVSALRALMRMTGLRYAAIDLVVTPAGKSYFLDLNPSGQFSWIEALTGMPIRQALADSLSAVRT